MRIGIDISQTAFPDTGVANYLKRLLDEMIKQGQDHEFVLFASSLRKKPSTEITELLTKYKNVELKNFKIPPRVLDILWNKMHVVPIEKFIGEVDLFITSDWTEPPAKKAKKATIIYDLIVYKYPEETDARIVDTQKRKLKWSVLESEVIFCISESTKKDAEEILGVDNKRLRVLYPGVL